MYDYCVDNPLSRVDPSGLWTRETFDEARVNRDDIGRFASGGGGSGQAARPAEGQQAPAQPGETGVFINNPCNIRSLALRKRYMLNGGSWEGESGMFFLNDQKPNDPNPPDPLAKFESMEYGVRAAAKNIMTRYREGANTVKKLMERWSPQHENDTEEITARISKWMGVGPDDELDFTDRDTLIKIVKYISWQENGPNRHLVTPQQIETGVDLALEKK